MKPESAKALAWTALAFVVLAFVIMSPTGAFALIVLAIVFAAIPSLFAPKRVRAFSLALLVISILLAVNFYPAFQHERELYAQRVKERTAKPGITPSTEQGALKK